MAPTTRAKAGSRLERVADSSGGAAARVDRFLSRLGLGHRLVRVLIDGLVLGLVLFVAVWIVDELLPRWSMAGRVSAACVWLALVGAAWWRSRVSLAEADARLGLRDGLRTWCGGTGDGPMRGWLATRLDSRFAQLQAGDDESVFVPTAPLRRKLRPLRVLVPIWLALIVLRWLAPAADRLAVATLGPTSPTEADSRGDDQDAAEESRDLPDPPAPESDTPPPEPAPPAAQEPDPNPLIDRPSEDSFAIPTFVGDGPSRPGQAHVARVSAGGDDPQAAAQGGADVGPLDRLPDAVFERAVERALSGRHVTEREREFVRGYFRLLVEQRR